jgi:hypothetical protein
MKTINKIANKLGLRKRRYYTLMVRREDYFSFKVLAAEQKKTHVDFLKELLTVYLECKKKNHEATIADLLKKQDALVDELLLYQKRIGKIYR